MVERADADAVPVRSGPAPSWQRDLTAPERQAIAGGHVIGVGLRPRATPTEVDVLVHQALADAALPDTAVSAVATVESRADHPALADLPWPVVSYPAEVLAVVVVPDPRSRVSEALGTPSVAEAAALLAAGPGAELVVPKRRADAVTVAVARTLSSPSDPEDHP